MKWYFKAIQKDKEYKAPHKNLIDVFDHLQYTDEQIVAEINKNNVEIDYFFYYMGLSYYDKHKY